MSAQDSSCDLKALSTQRTVQISDDDFIYILVFPNLFSRDPNLKEQLQNRKFSKAKCAEIFKSAFKISEDENNDLRNDLNKDFNAFLKDSQEEIEYHRFLLLILMCLFKIFETKLMLRIKLFFSRDKDEIFCKIGVSDYNSKVQACLSDYLVQLDRKDEEKCGYSFISPYAIFEMDIEDSQDDSENLEKLYKAYKYDEKKAKMIEERFTMFRYKDKVRLLFEMITSVVDIPDLIDNKIITAGYCVHNMEQLTYLRKNWGSFWAIYKPQNFKEIRKYFGEKIAIYFAWLDYYVKWLILPAILGSALFWTEFHYQDMNDKSKEMTKSEVGLLIFSVFLALGSALLDKLWIRRQNELSWMWGTVDLNVVELQRPGFKGVYRKDPISGRQKKFSNKIVTEGAKRIIGINIAILFASVVFITVGGIFFYRSTRTASDLGGQWHRICALMNAVQIQVMNFVYRKVAKVLTDWENYEYDSQYFDSLIFKLYLFQFVNSYISLFYIAFVKYYIEGCGLEEDCMSELRTQLGVIFIIKMLLNFIELGKPIIMRKIKLWKERKEIEKSKQRGEQVREEMTLIEAQNKLEDYETPLDDYMEIVIDYGYVVMFSAALPLVPLLALGMNILEIRVDSYKLCWLTKRPFPMLANSIGYWQVILRSISTMGALTNTGIMIFTIDIFDLDHLTEKWLYFMIIEHLILLFKYTLYVQFNDTPQRVTKGLVWGNRIAAERMYGRAHDESQKDLRGLYFKDLQGRNDVVLDPYKISKENN
ncbi:unnamed protein product [Blepharisma stoltei]|uniref:Anoctamin transmembrane domain-containing protein n=1 Tax=Blepharisma stoltei TaxID=1481888 RepID=A0AAU9KA61_9CILI|nr:unnamed protein product [Blepharisma stoltei]